MQHFIWLVLIEVCTAICQTITWKVITHKSRKLLVSASTRLHNTIKIYQRHFIHLTTPPQPIWKSNKTRFPIQLHDLLPFPPFISSDGQVLINPDQGSPSFLPRGISKHKQKQIYILIYSGYKDDQGDLKGCWLRVNEPVKYTDSIPANKE